RGGVKYHNGAFNAADFTVQDGIGGFGPGDDAGPGTGQEFVDHGGGEPLLDTITGSTIYEGPHGDGLYSRGNLGGAAGYVVAAAGQQQRDCQHGECCKGGGGAGSHIGLHGG